MSRLEKDLGCPCHIGGSSFLCPGLFVPRSLLVVTGRSSALLSCLAEHGRGFALALRWQNPIPLHGVKDTHHP